MASNSAIQTSSSSIPFQVTHSCLVASLQGIVDDAELIEFQKRILQAVKSTAILGVVLDMSQLDMIDDITFERLSKIADSLRMLGTSVAYSGFQPPVVAALVHFEADTSPINAFHNLEAAIVFLNQSFQIAEKEADLSEPEPPENPPQQEQTDE